MIAKQIMCKTEHEEELLREKYTEFEYKINMHLMCGRKLIDCECKICPDCKSFIDSHGVCSCLGSNAVR